MTRGGPSPWPSPPSSAASLASADPGRIRVIVGLPPVRAGLKLWGPAYTVRGVAGDNLALHRGLARARPGDVLVVQLVGDQPRGHWGELMTIAAQAAGVAGLVIGGAIRDSAAIAARDFPVFHRGTHPAPAGKVVAGDLQVPVDIDSVRVAPGDGIFGDDDGIVVVPAADLATVVAAAIRVDAREADIAAKLAGGLGTMQVLGLRDRSHAASDERGTPS